MAPEALLDEGFDAVYVATGFQKDTPLQHPGRQGPRRASTRRSTLLDRVRRGERPDMGKKALVIGGGDTAMDAVRTSRRLTGNPATIVYRRTRAEMPASPEEIEGALEEGNILEELVSPVRVRAGRRGQRDRPGVRAQQAGRARRRWPPPARGHPRQRLRHPLRLDHGGRRADARLPSSTAVS